MFGADWSKILVSMETESRHCLIKGKTMYPHIFSVVFDPILFILADNEDMHKISDEFELWPDLTTDYGVSCLERFF